LRQPPLGFIGTETAAAGLQSLEDILGRELVNIVIANVGHRRLVQ
jgi:hypothetical protein